MLRNLARLSAALALFLSANVAGAQAPPPPAGPGVAISDLIGRDPAAVRARLVDVAAGWPVPPAFQIATADGVLTLISVADLTVDPVLAQRMAAFRTSGDPPAAGAYLLCEASLIQGDGSRTPGDSLVLTFRDGRLESVAQPAKIAVPPPPPYTDRKAQLAYIRRPVSSPFIARFGELPLEDGTGFLSRMPKAVLAPDDRLSAACSPAPAPSPAIPHARHEGLSASDMQGLAILPFAITLPGMNRQRVAARRDGAALLAMVRVGEPLGAAPETFAATHKGVRAYPVAQGDYAVLSLDMGAYPGRNLTNFNDVALVGVRRGRIAWIAPPASLGPHAALLCLDEHGVPNTPRRGCSGWGHFSP